jgi:hypothetical protein
LAFYGTRIMSGAGPCGPDIAHLPDTRAAKLSI